MVPCIGVAGPGDRGGREGEALGNRWRKDTGMEATNSGAMQDVER